MLFNKRRYRKVNDKKVLHKVHSKWIVVSSALLGMIGMGAVAATPITHADTTPVHAGQVNANAPKATNVQTKSAGSSSNSQAPQKAQSSAGSSASSSASKVVAAHNTDATNTNPQRTNSVKSNVGHIYNYKLNAQKPSTETGRQTTTNNISSTEASAGTADNSVKSASASNSTESKGLVSATKTFAHSAVLKSVQSSATKSGNVKTPVKGVNSLSASKGSKGLNLKPFKASSASMSSADNGLSDRMGSDNTSAVNSQSGSSNASGFSAGSTNADGQQYNLSGSGKTVNTSANTTVDNNLVNAVFDPDANNAENNDSNVALRGGANDNDLAEDTGHNNADTNVQGTEDPYETDAYEPNVTVNYLNANRGFSPLATSTVKSKAGTSYLINNDGSIEFADRFVSAPAGYKLAPVSSLNGADKAMNYPGQYTVTPRTRDNNGNWSSEDINLGVVPEGNVDENGLSDRMGSDDEQGISFRSGSTTSSGNVAGGGASYNTPNYETIDSGHHYNNNDHYASAIAALINSESRNNQGQLDQLNNNAASVENSIADQAAVNASDSAAVVSNAEQGKNSQQIQSMNASASVQSLQNQLAASKHAASASIAAQSGKDDYINNVNSANADLNSAADGMMQSLAGDTNLTPGQYAQAIQALNSEETSFMNGTASASGSAAWAGLKTNLGAFRNSLLNNYGNDQKTNQSSEVSSATSAVGSTASNIQSTINSLQSSNPSAANSLQSAFNSDVSAANGDLANDKGNQSALDSDVDKLASQGAGIDSNATGASTVASTSGRQGSESDASAQNAATNSQRNSTVDSINANPNLTSAQKASLDSAANSYAGALDNIINGGKNSLPTTNPGDVAGSEASSNVASAISSATSGMNASASATEQSINNNNDLTPSQQSLDDSAVTSTLSSAASDVAKNSNVPSIQSKAAAINSAIAGDLKNAQQQAGWYASNPYNPDEKAPTGYHYDVAGQLVPDNASDNGFNDPLGYRYGANGQILPGNAMTPNGYSYGPNGQLIPNNNNGYHYNTQGQLVPNTGIGYHYDSNGNLQPNNANGWNYGVGIPAIPNGGVADGYYDPYATGTGKASEGLPNLHFDKGDWMNEQALASRYGLLNSAYQNKAVNDNEYAAYMAQLNKQAFSDGSNDAKSGFEGNSNLTSNSAYTDGYYSYTDGYMDGAMGRDMNMNAHDPYYAQEYAAAYKDGQKYTADQKNKAAATKAKNDKAAAASYANGYRDSRNTLLAAGSLGGHSDKYIMGYVNGMNDRLSHNPDYVIAKSAITLHSSPKFSNKNVVANVPFTSRNKASEFIVNGVSADDNGDVRYHVIGIGAAGGGAKGTSGWIPADQNSVEDSYYRGGDAARHGDRIRIIAHTALVHNTSSNWSKGNAVKHLHYGQEVQIKGIVKIGDIYRFYIAPGEYVTANKAFTEWLH